MPAPPTLTSHLAAALDRRRSLLADPTIEALRLFHGRADGIDNLVIEKWGPILVVQHHEGLPGPTPDALRPVIEERLAGLNATAAYLKHFVRNRGEEEPQVRPSHQEPAPWIGQIAPEEFPVREGECRFLIRAYDGFSVGLFLEHRENRRRLAGLAKGRRVLNAFAYTCGFSVAAAAAGAAAVASVDLSKRYLEWGKRNFAANGLPLEAHRFYASDLFDFYRRARRQQLKFDLIILDPPTFSRRRRPDAVFSLRKELPRLVADSVGLLDPGGILFLATNDRQIRMETLESALRCAVPHRVPVIIDRPALPSDFHGDPGYAKSILARFD